MNNLPDDFMKEGLELAKTTTIFGIKLEELSYDELLATCANGCNIYIKSLESKLNKEFLKD